MKLTDDFRYAVNATRGKGKTRVALQAVRYANGTLVVHSEDFRQAILNQNPDLQPENVVSLRSLIKLRGRTFQGPLVVDPDAVVTILDGLEAEIQRQKERLRRFKVKIRDVMNMFPEEG